VTFPSTPVVWIVNHYSTIPSKDGAGNRHFRLAQQLAANGWQPVLFLASTRHPSGEQHIDDGGWRRVGREGGVPYVMLKSPAYGNGIARLLNMVMFAAKLLVPKATRGVPAPDLIVGSTVHLLAAWSALRLARRHRVPFVFEIRDIWPETLVDLGALSASNPLSRAISRFSRHLCANADLVIAPLPGVRTYLDGLGLSHVPFEWVSNGVDLPNDDGATEVEPAGDDGDFTLMYLGSHGNANGLTGLLDAFEVASSEMSGSRTLRLRLVGEGSQKEGLQKYAATLRAAEKITFEPRIPREDVTERAREADALVVNVEDLPVYRFGISLNKLYDYLASGRPTVIASSAQNNPIADADAGICVPASDPLALASAMRRISEQSAEQRDSMGARGIDHVRRNYTYDALGVALSEALGEAVGRFTTTDGETE